MAEMGDGYGSECHLLRYLGRHRSQFDKLVLATTGGQMIEWLDFPFDTARRWQDAEWKGLDFLPENCPARSAWRNAWPQRGNPPNWDAVGKLTLDGSEEWLLVEAKANLEELRSSCQASDAGGRLQIDRTIAATKIFLGVQADRDWLNGYYQYCNRIAVLGFLVKNGVPTRLLNIYFVGDRGDQRRTCPSAVEGWKSALETLKAHVGLPKGHPLNHRVHELFIGVVPPS